MSEVAEFISPQNLCLGTYELALQHLGVAREEIGFLSANGFDVAGAKAFGFTVYWVNRMGAVLDELGIAPDATVQSLAEVASLSRSVL